MIPVVLYCDNHLLVVDKPPMLVTQPTEGHRTSLEEWAKQWIKQKFNKPGAVFLHAIHRLDKEVSGIVLFARTSKALSRLNESMRKGDIRKTYLAIVEGTLPATEGVLENELEHVGHRALIRKNVKSKKAILHYEVIEKKGDKALLRIELETGRYHQIRAQLSHIGCPIVGDKKYGSKCSSREPGVALCHAQIFFTHPISNKKMRIESCWIFPKCG
ncbi:MAG: RluA family pseudouridine synthase [Simkania sp.]|nr:RluA family pseudouridine synthase [Simkania sp.]